MYHIKSDRRSRNTAEEICVGLLKCLEEKPLNSVTISDIHRVTGISRSTFYRLFDTVEDVLVWLSAQPPREEEEHLLKQGCQSPAQVFSQLLKLGLENHVLLKALVDNGRYDLVYRYAEQRFRLMNALYPDSLPQLGEAEYDYVVSSMAMNMVATLATWIRRGQVETPEEVSLHAHRYVSLMAGLVNQQNGDS